jgi:preprotein translocase subunit SecF
LALFIWGGAVIHNFSIGLLFGVVFGTYSSIFIASPMALMLGICPEDLMVPIREGSDIDQMP